MDILTTRIYDLEMKATIIGSTGLTGQKLLNNLLSNPNITKVQSITRRSTGLTHPKLKELICDLNELLDYQDEINGDHFFCCIGTTIKKAKSKENFWKVDFEIPLKFAGIAKNKDAKSFSLISAQGANEKSLFFYNQVKGKLEAELLKLKIPTLLIYRPGLLLGDRKEKRFGEDAGHFMIGLLQKVLSKEKISQLATQSHTLAEVMNSQFDQFHGTHFFKSSEIMKNYSGTAGK